MTSKNKLKFSCKECNYISLKWIGCCPSCKSWDSFEQITQDNSKSVASIPSHKTVNMHSVSTILSINKKKIITGIKEWDRVVGNGIMPGSLIVLTGDPGIGKSTLLLQISNKIAKSSLLFYFSTEESLAQIKQRSERLSCLNEALLISDEACLEKIIFTIQKHNPALVVIDSIQNCYLEESNALPGSISQLKEATFRLMRLAKERSVTILVSGHINKEGSIAGPKTLEHMVDAVFYLQGEDRLHTRILRSVKNRFGSINEVGFFEMHKSGLLEVKNVNQELLRDTLQSPGSVLISFIEGSRPILLELQALTVQSKLILPQRVISGINHKQVVLIAAILEKYLKIKFSSYDIFCKVTGGFVATGSSSDLGIALALLSSYFQKPLPVNSLILGEIGLNGSIKPINQIALYIKEAEKFEIKNIFISSTQKATSSYCNLYAFKNVYELLRLFPN